MELNGGNSVLAFSTADQGEEVAEQLKRSATRWWLVKNPLHVADFMVFGLSRKSNGRGREEDSSSKELWTTKLQLAADWRCWRHSFGLAWQYKELERWSLIRSMGERKMMLVSKR